MKLVQVFNSGSVFEFVNRLDVFVNQLSIQNTYKPSIPKPLARRLRKDSHLRKISRLFATLAVTDGLLFSVRGLPLEDPAQRNAEDYAELGPRPAD